MVRICEDVMLERILLKKFVRFLRQAVGGSSGLGAAVANSAVLHARVFKELVDYVRPFLGTSSLETGVFVDGFNGLLRMSSNLGQCQNRCSTSQ